MQDYTALRDVIAICRDAEHGFRGAGNAVKTPSLRTLFEGYSAQRGEFARELHQGAKSMGMEIDDSLGLGGVLYAGWMELKGVLSGHNEHQILVEADRGEEISLRSYREALAMNLSDGVRALLQKQMDHVQEAHDRIHALRDLTARNPSAKEERDSARDGS